MLLPPQLWCGHDKVYIVAKILPPGNKDIAQLPTHYILEIMK